MLSSFANPRVRRSFLIERQVKLGTTPMRRPSVRRLGYLAASLLILVNAPGAVFACGWWGDGEMNIFGNADISFVPRGNDRTTDPSEMARLSTAYRLGTGVEPNREAAITWAQRAAAAGHAGAMNDLASMYESGFHGEIDTAGAAFWYSKAAELGVPAAQHSLALMLRAGNGADIDETAADMWLRKSARGGHSIAAADLAELIWRGETVPGFPDEACFWWLVAIEAGHVGAAERCVAEIHDLSEDRFKALGVMARAALRE